MPLAIDLEKYKDVQLPTLYQQQIHLTKYSRWNENLNRRETWPETVFRYMKYMVFQAEKFGVELEPQLQTELFEAILNLEVMPSMRALLSAGPALDRDNAAGYNCAYLHINRVEAFDEAMYILMCMAGVGFSVERQYVNQLPNLPESLHDTDSTIVVEDSRIGWAISFRQLLNMLYSGCIPKFDVSKVRPEGAPLKIFGGRASGPGPLVDLFKFTINMFKSAVSDGQKKLTSFQCHSIMCKIGSIVQAGGVRRSALISLSNPSDDRMRHAKTGQWWENNPHFSLANNSAAWTEKPDIELFMKEWMSLIESKSGERGIYNRQAARDAAGRSGRRNTEFEFGINPCQPGFATVLTQSGIKTFDEINIGDIIWSGKQWTKIINKVFTGVKNVFKYKTTAGSFIGTENHRIVQRSTKIEVKDAEYIDTNLGPYERIISINSDDVIDGLVFGDGTVHKASNNRVLLCVGNNDQEYFESKEVGKYIGSSYADEKMFRVETSITFDELPKTYDRVIPSRFYKGNLDKKCGFLRGLYSANGSVVSNRITFKTSSFTVVEQLQEMLSSIGISSYYTKNLPHKVDFSNGVYEIKQSYDVNIGNIQGRIRFQKLIGFIQEYKNQKLEDINSSVKRYFKSKKSSFQIMEIEDLGNLPVYDITVEADEHTYWTGGLLVSNCSEIILRDRQFCNLTEVVIRYEDDFDSIRHKVELATILGTIQSTITGFRYLSEEWKKNTEEERLLGVSLTGIFDNELMTGKKLFFGKVSLSGALFSFKETAVCINKEWAEKLGINQSTAITCVKPSGTVSQLCNSSSGLHPRHAPYYIRTNRANKIDPVAMVLRDSGIPCENDVMNPEVMWVFSFPQKAPEGAVCRQNLSAIDHLNLWMQYQEHWCEHKPSVTISVRNDEWLEVGAFVYKHFDKMSGVSFLPYSDHNYAQAPYQEISQEEYIMADNQMPEHLKLELLEVYETDDMTTSAREYSCTGGTCEIL